MGYHEVALYIIIIYRIDSFLRHPIIFSIVSVFCVMIPKGIIERI